MKAIIFDCDGVLVDSEVLYQEIQMGALADIGLIYEKEAYITRFMGTGDTNYYAQVANDYSEKFDAPLPDDFKDTLKAKLEREFAVRLQAIAGVDTLLGNITKPKAVASSSYLSFLHKKLKQTSLDGHFGDHVYSADQVARAKPHPDLFLFTAEKLGMAPEECTVIEDSENGVRAGLAAGMRTIGFLGGAHVDAAYGEKLKALGAHEIAENARELQTLL